MENIINLIKSVLIYAHSFVITKTNNQYLIPIYINREIITLPFYKTIRPISYSFDESTENTIRDILIPNLSYKYGFKQPIKVNIEIFDNDKFITKEIII